MTQLLLIIVFPVPDIGASKLYSGCFVSWYSVTVDVTTAGGEKDNMGNSSSNAADGNGVGQGNVTWSELLADLVLAM